MPLPRYERLAEDKRRRLMEVASAEFIAKGYEGASLNSILAGADLGKSSYYYYFADKEDLYATVIEDALARLDAETPPPELAALEASSFWPALEAYAVAATAAFAKNPERLALIRPLQAMWQKQTPRLAPLIEKTRAQLQAGIELGRRLGCVRTDLDVESLIFIVEAADRALDERLLRQPQITPEMIRSHARLVLDTFRRVLEPTHLPAPPP